MQLGVFKENDNESRVALVPEVVLGLKEKHSVFIESGAGDKAGFSNEDYIKAGAIICSRDEILEKCELLIAINGQIFFDYPVKDKILLGLFDPYFNRQQIITLKNKQATVISLELIPRISRAQSMDVLSSQANISGYMAAILAANYLGKILPLMMTAAGTIKPAKVLILGAGVAGLQAIATAKRLQALVYAYDVREAVKEQVESLGAKFIDLKLQEKGEGTGGYAKALSKSSQEEQRQKLTLASKDMDIIIATAQIPGKKAPVLLDENIFTLLKKGSVIIDMAAATGGNIPGSITNQWVEKSGIKLYGADNLSRFLPKDASFTFSKNIQAFLELLFLTKDLYLEDEILKEAVICSQGHWVNKNFSEAT
jgi:NAD(P) transhydrogenase subunit alpha